MSNCVTATNFTAGQDGQCGTHFSPDKAAPLHTMPPSSDAAMPISRVGNSRSTGSPAKNSLP